jgi:FdrA protein
MTVTVSEIRQGAYFDSVVLMQLQKSLAALAGITDAGVMMGTEANKQVLESGHLLTSNAINARAEDLIIAVNAQDEATGRNAIAQVDELVRKRQSVVDEEYRPHSLDAAISMLPNAKWVLISVPGRYAASVAREALGLGLNVFLYSDNVSIDDEVSLKQTALEKGLLVMGPDCGTAIINGAGLGFANQVHRGNIGIVAASGTGLQAVSVRIDRLGGVSHAIGTGSHDLSDNVKAITTLQGLELLKRDTETSVIVLISKPPSPEVAAAVLASAQETGKPVVVDFIGYVPSAMQVGNLHFVRTLDEAAENALKLIGVPLISDKPTSTRPEKASKLAFAQGQQYLRGLYAGGTLAYEAQLIARDHGLTVYSNAPLDKALTLANPNASYKNSIVDLGADEFMVGRLHPMIDNDLRIRRLRQESDDASIAVILLDVVLGYGAHPDPASELAPAIRDVKKRSEMKGRYLEVVTVVVGTDQDPQNYSRQVDQLRAAGAFIAASHVEAIDYACMLIEKPNDTTPTLHAPTSTYSTSASSPRIAPPPSLASLAGQFAAINIGLESFHSSLKEQNVPTVQVDWRPPAGGNEKLMALLARMKKGNSEQSH